MGTQRPPGEREPDGEQGREGRPPPEDRDGGVDPDERVADGPAGATEAETPGMGS
jgi:hypothetical protein